MNQEGGAPLSLLCLRRVCHEASHRNELTQRTSWFFMWRLERLCASLFPCSRARVKRKVKRHRKTDKIKEALFVSLVLFTIITCSPPTTYAEHNCHKAEA